MKRLQLLLFISLVFLPQASLLAKSSKHKISSKKNSELAIHTYGGGELLEKVFRGISMLVYGNSKTGTGKTFKALIRLALIIGGFSSICMILSQGKLDALIKSFFLPAIGIVTFLLVPRTNVYIYDHLVQSTPSANVSSLKKVEDIPFFMGKFATLLSTASHILTKAFEAVTHGVNDSQYNWTGHIYAGDQFFNAKKNKIGNPQLEDSFREFCRECVFRDIGVGLYSKDDLVKTPDILAFLESNTSNIRTVFIKEFATEDDVGEQSVAGSFYSCKDAIKAIREQLGHPKSEAKKIAIEEIASDLGFLLNHNKNGKSGLKDLMKQQLAIDVLKEELPGDIDSFAVKRADLQQQNQQKILGALGARSIVATQNYFEAIIYTMFPLVIIFSLLSFGIKPLLNWVQFCLWVNIWPPFYVIVNFLLSSLWNMGKMRNFGSCSELTLTTSEGLSDLYSSMEAIAAISMAFIPFLSWVILKGGVSQMVHLSSSLTGPSQTAAATSAAEMTTGNYSYGNVSLDNTNANNAQHLQQNYSGSLSLGKTSIDQGSETLSHVDSSDNLYLRQNDSYLREGITKSDTFSSSLQESLNSSETALTDSSRATSDTITDTSNKAVGLVNALSKQIQTGHSSNSQEMTSQQEAVHFLNSISNEYASSKGISRDEGMRELISAGVSVGLKAPIFGGIDGGTQYSKQGGASLSYSDNEAARYASTDQFQEHLQTIRNLSTSDVKSLMGSEDTRLHEDLSHSWNQADSTSEQWRSAYTRQQALSELSSITESENLSLQQNLNQRFVEYTRDQYGRDSGKVAEVMNLPSNSSEKRTLIDGFIQTYRPEGNFEGDQVSIHRSHQENLGEMPKSESHFEKESVLLSERGKTEIRNMDSESNIDSSTRNAKDEQQEMLSHHKSVLQEGMTHKKSYIEEEIDRDLYEHFESKTSFINGGKKIYNKMFSK
ncbi:MAG: conjugal transfer protein TraG N-terminal domain-containing protein (plasmid) [Candidatus Algichlamydia australiensis]|nr:conjugal transfer protein TraG N-terminal domain-containing protein [Chlamydiales bacterium]